MIIERIATDAFGNALGSSLISMINDSGTAARIAADQMRSGQDEAAIEKSTWSARDVATPGASAVLNDLGYAAAGSAPQMLHTAQAGGHYYLPCWTFNFSGLAAATFLICSALPPSAARLRGYVFQQQFRLVAHHKMHIAYQGGHWERTFGDYSYGLETMPVHALLLQGTNDAFHHAILLRAMRRDELLLEAITMHQGREAAAREN